MSSSIKTLAWTTAKYISAIALHMALLLSQISPYLLKEMTSPYVFVALAADGVTEVGSIKSLVVPKLVLGLLHPSPNM